MLKKRARLTKKEFDQFFTSGKRFHTHLLQLIYTPHDTFHGAAVAGKKVSKKAFVRNKLRRRLYAALYALKKEHDLPGVFIAIAKPSAEQASYTELKDALDQLIGRINQSR